jgi:outer membrane protein TolC
MINKVINIVLFFCLPALSCQVVKGQALGSIALDSALVWAEHSYPLTQEMSFIQQSEKLSLENVSRGVWPQLVVVGQATYQSDVTSLAIPVPGFSAPEISKDQYRLYGEISQSLTDLYTNKQQKKKVKAVSEAEKTRHEVNLYAVKQRVQQIYFGILLIQEQLQLLDIIQKDLHTAFETAQVAVKNGVALQGSEEVIRAELLGIEQKRIEVESGLNVYREWLSAFIQKELNEHTIFEKPSELHFKSMEIHRPELQVLRASFEQLQAQSALTQIKTLPRLSLFLQSGLGRPALNMLDNDLAWYYIGGVRLQWNVSALYTQSREQKTIGMQQKRIEAQKNTFLFNTKLQLTQQDIELEKWKRMSESDLELVLLREKLKQTAQVQLENGSISSTEYLTYVHAEEKARQNSLIHEMQWLMAQYNRKLTAGN